MKIPLIKLRIYVGLKKKQKYGMKSIFYLPRQKRRKKYIKNIIGKNMII